MTLFQLKVPEVFKVIFLIRKILVLYKQRQTPRKCNNMEKPDLQNLEEKAAMTRIYTQSCTTNHMLHSW